MSGSTGTVLLQDNGGDDLNVSSDGPFTFATPLADGTAYDVTVKTSPSGQTCTATNATGTVASANVTGVTITCTASGPPASYSVGGTVSGSTGTVVLQDNGGDDLNVSSDGPFTFATPLADGTAYDVTVKTSPSGQTCTATNATGTVASANVTGVAVTCTTSQTTSAEDDFNRADGDLGPDWAAMSDGGLSIASQQVVGTDGALAGDVRAGESYGSDQYSQIAVTSTSLPVGDWVGPTVRSQNGGQDTYLGLYWNDQITGNYELLLFVRQSGNWTQLGNTYTLDGPLPAGTELTLSAIGSTISLQENGIERVAATDTNLTGGAPGVMTFGAATADNWAGGTGNPPSPSTYSIGGTVSGLSGTVVLQDNGGDDLSVSSDGPFTFATPLVDGTGYDVTVETSPSGQTCTGSNATGTLASANATSVTITCTTNATVTPSLQIQYAGTDVNGVASYDFTSADDGGGTHVLRVLNPTHPAPGVPHNFLYVLPVEPELGSVYGDGLDTLRSLDAEDQYNLTIIEPAFPTAPWYANNCDDPSMQYETFMTKDLVPWVTQTFGSADAATQPLAPLQGPEQNWLIGFSKSGIGGQDLLLKHPDIFTLAASWDFPADMSSYTQYGADNYGTQGNFDANYRLTPSFVDAHEAPFLSQNRIWMGEGDTFASDVADYDGLLTSDGVLHTTTTTTQQMAHRWDSGWMPMALSAMSQEGAALAATP